MKWIRTNRGVVNAATLTYMGYHQVSREAGYAFEVFTVNEEQGMTWATGLAERQAQQILDSICRWLGDTRECADEVFDLSLVLDHLEPEVTPC